MPVALLSGVSLDACAAHGHVHHPQQQGQRFCASCSDQTSTSVLGNSPQQRMQRRRVGSRALGLIRRVRRIIARSSPSRASTNMDGYSGTNPAVPHQESWITADVATESSTKALPSSTHRQQPEAFLCPRPTALADCALAPASIGDASTKRVAATSLSILHRNISLLNDLHLAAAATPAGGSPTGSSPAGQSPVGGSPPARQSPVGRSPNKWEASGHSSGANSLPGSSPVAGSPTKPSAPGSACTCVPVEAASSLADVPGVTSKQGRFEGALVFHASTEHAYSTAPVGSCKRTRSLPGLLAHVCRRLMRMARFLVRNMAPKGTSASQGRN